MKTELKERILWYDGTSQVSPEFVPELLLSGVPLNRIVVTENNDDIVLFNSLSDDIIPKEKLKNEAFDMSWNIPREYAKIDLDQYLSEKLSEFGPEYKTRTDEELKEIRLHGIEMLFKTLIYVVDQLKQSNTVWGVGRGSSCASLVLFLIGLHKVDPIKYKIPMTEFFH